VTERYADAGPVQRFARKAARVRPVSLFLARTLHHVDRVVYRRTSGRTTFAAWLSGLPLVMLTTTGARSGASRSVPVLGLPTDDGLVVIASNYGQDKHPAWYHNLRANPEGEVDVDGVRRSFRAVEAEGEQRDRIWEQGLRVYPGWSTYERRASHRRIAVFVLGPP
jgi:deazaflavin-dependent oxidoreductase (nitroreductase family)